MRTWWAKALIVVSRGFCQSSSQEAAKILAKTIWSLYTGDAFSGSPEQMTYRPVRSTERNPASANCLRYWLAAAFLRPTNSPAWTTCSSRLGDVAIYRSSDNRISLLRTRQIFQNSILLPFAAVVYHTFHLKTIVCKQWFSHAPPICCGRRGVVLYAALSGIDALSRAIERKSSGPDLWQAEIHKKTHGPGSEVIR